jgi:hypothetical protein
VWQVRGAVRFRITLLSGNNAVISGVFFDTPGGVPGNVPPTVTLGNPSGGPWTAPATVGLSATATDSDGSISQVGFYAGSNLIGTSPDTTSPFTFDWSSVPAGTYSITARATDNDTATTISGAVTVTVTAPGGGTQASYLGTDSTTQGTWKAVYGGDGYSLAPVSTSPPAYGSVTTSGAASYVWAATSSAPPALQQPVGSDRVAATWYSPASFTIDVNLTDGLPHQVSLYGLDWDNRGRSQRIEVLDAATQVVLDTRSVSGFVNGQYWVWQVRGAVRFRITLLSGNNAVISGVFFDTPGGAPGNVPPTVTLGNAPGGPTGSLRADHALFFDAPP